MIIPIVIGSIVLFLTTFIYEIKEAQRSYDKYVAKILHLLIKDESFSVIAIGEDVYASRRVSLYVNNEGKMKIKIRGKVYVIDDDMGVDLRYMQHLLRISFGKMEKTDIGYTFYRSLFC